MNINLDTTNFGETLHDALQHGGNALLLLVHHEVLLLMANGAHGLQVWQLTLNRTHSVRLPNLLQFLGQHSRIRFHVQQYLGNVQFNQAHQWISQTERDVELLANVTVAHRLTHRPTQHQLRYLTTTIRLDYVYRLNWEGMGGYLQE